MPRLKRGMTTREIGEEELKLARMGLDPGESRNPVIKVVRAFTPAVDYWVPARASPVEPGSLGRDDGPQ